MRQDLILIMHDDRYSSDTNTIGYYHVELIRCHEFPSIEGVYIIEVCRDLSSYKVWPADPDSGKLGWKWKFSDIVHCIWHPNGTKLEVQCQRYYTIVLWCLINSASSVLLL